MLCESCHSSRSCVRCCSCCRRGTAEEKEICSLKWKWFFLILTATLKVTNYSSPLPSLHQFVTNPTAQQLNGTGREIEPGLGLSETFYHWVIATYSFGEVLGALLAAYIVSRIPFWYSIMLSLLTNIAGFVFYATAINGWMMITSRVLTGTYCSMQTVLALTYFGVSYPLYLEALGKEQRVREEQKTTKVKDRLFAFHSAASNAGFLLGTVVAAILVQFPIDHFRSIGWFNVILGVLYAILLLAVFRGESRCHCENVRQKYGCTLPEISNWKKTVTVSNLVVILIISFLIIARGMISAKFVIYEELFNPILSDSFGFSVKDTSYFFVLLLPATLGAFIVPILQTMKLNSRVITILGIAFGIIGLTLMADWQSIPYDPCTEFSLFHHPGLASGVSNTSLPPCPTVLPDCPWLNDSLRHNTTAAMTSEEEVAVAAVSLQHMEPFSPRHPVVNEIAYGFAMNVCESLSSSQYHCHWIPNSVITHRLCHACPPICRSIDRTLNFVQYMIGAAIFRLVMTVPRIAIMIVLSDVVSRKYQGLVLGLATASTGFARSIAPLFIGAAYEGVQKRTFLAMSIMMSLQVPLILTLLLLYRKLGRMKEQLQAQVGNTAAPVSSETSPGEKEPSLSDEEDTTEMSELLHEEVLEKK